MGVGPMGSRESEEAAAVEGCEAIVAARYGARVTATTNRGQQEATNKPTALLAGSESEIRESYRRARSAQVQRAKHRLTCSSAHALSTHQPPPTSSLSPAPATPHYHARTRVCSSSSPRPTGCSTKLWRSPPLLYHRNRQQSSRHRSRRSPDGALHHRSQCHNHHVDQQQQ